MFGSDSGARQAKWETVIFEVSDLKKKSLMILWTFLACINTRNILTFPFRLKLKAYLYAVYYHLLIHLVSGASHPKLLIPKCTIVPNLIND